MLVTNLVSWAGDDFSSVPGDVIDLPDTVAVARVNAGLAALIPADDTPAKRQPGRPRKAD